VPRLSLRKILSNGIPQRLKVGLGSVSVNAVWLFSYFPNNRLRVWILRVFGARVGRGVAIHRGLTVRGVSGIAIGNDCFIAENVTLDGRGGLTIGAHVSINMASQIWTAGHDLDSEDFAYMHNGVHIQDCAWICSGAILLPGATMSEGSVVAAGGVLTGHAPSWTVMGGIPASYIRERRSRQAYELRAAQNKVWWG